ncbi:MAG: DUF763 domain-containing protein [Candidatus Nanohaloarchaea archaeon]
MAKSGTADLPLHTGKAPRWLFDRMEELGGKISEVIIEEHGQEVLLERLADPYWFQAFGCVLGFDWHSSGLTTTTMGALKQALEPEEHGLKVVGGKGSASRNTPEEIAGNEFNLSTSAVERLQDISRKSAAVDNSTVQDSYTLYHHTMVVSEEGDWVVVQQGMNDSYARRYHWLSSETEGLLEDPQAAVASQRKRDETLNLSSSRSGETREISVDLVNDNPSHLMKYVNGQHSLDDFSRNRKLDMPQHHILRDSDLSEKSIEQLQEAYEVQPADYEELLSVKGVGKKSLRALALISELVYGSESSWDDPAKYSYAHGGKDGTPYPVDREKYDESIEHLEHALEKTEDGKHKRKAMKRLSRF